MKNRVWGVTTELALPSCPLKFLFREHNPSSLQHECEDESRKQRRAFVELQVLVLLPEDLLQQSPISTFTQIGRGGGNQETLSMESDEGQIGAEKIRVSPFQNKFPRFFAKTHNGGVRGVCYFWYRSRRQFRDKARRPCLPELLRQLRTRFDMRLRVVSVDVVLRGDDNIFGCVALSCVNTVTNGAVPS